MMVVDGNPLVVALTRITVASIIYGNMKEPRTARHTCPVEEHEASLLHGSNVAGQFALRHLLPMRGHSFL